MFDIKLSLDDLLKLDGTVAEEVQKVIDEAKKESSYGFDLPVMNEIIKEAEKIGKLSWSYKQIRSCDYCDKKPDYYRYPRNGRYHRKGDKNFDKPIYYSGIKFNEGFVRIAGYGDMCSECCNKHRVKERIIDFILDNDLKIEIMKNDYKPGNYLKDDIRICFECNEEMLESKMSKEMTLMGGGYYPSGCPKCGAKSLPFGRSHKITSKFGFIHNPASNTEVIKIKELVSKYNQGVSDDEKIHITQNKNSIYSFYVEETKFTNGYLQVISFNTQSKKFKVGYSYENKCEDLKDVLLKLGYLKIED